ncbi:unnamed protein product [Adineta ricciae]|uniref:Voltage-gated hydrogen channel 1 n=1 Tax=Adineta ricciae TaxID=249248 RepID=A0A815MNM1_ADIRI|nr:unnamed protein product [Adineta ricciae]CAF1418726.1 unnamed protein product [Adineta ricciae]
MSSSVKETTTNKRNRMKFENNFLKSKDDKIKDKSTRSSVGETKLNEIIHDLNDNTLENEVVQIDGHSKWIKKSRKFIVHLMEQPTFHYAIIVLIILDLIIVFVELIIAQLSLPCLTDDELEKYNVTEQRSECLLSPSTSTENAETALYYVSLVLISIFVIEILCAFYGFGWRRYTKLLYLLDAIIVIASFIMEVYFHFGNIGKAGRAAAGLVVLRLWKIIRAIHAIAHSMALRNHMIVTEIEKARNILNEEKVRAENVIRVQSMEIQELKNMLYNRKRSNSVISLSF